MEIRKHYNLSGGFGFSLLEFYELTDLVQT